MGRNIIDMRIPTYSPARLINAVADFLGAKCDSHLAELLGFDPTQIGRVRHRATPITSGIIVAILDRTGWPITKVRELMGVPFGGAISTAPPAG